MDIEAVNKEVKKSVGGTTKITRITDYVETK